MSASAAIRTVRTLWRVYRHRKAGHVLIVDPRAVTCQTCTCGVSGLDTACQGLAESRP